MAEFKEWLEKKIVSFDFDSTLTAPYYDDHSEYWKEGDPTNPQHINWENVNKLKKYADEGWAIYIVSSRSHSEQHGIEHLVRELSLPVSKIVCTNGMNKGPILNQLGCLIHYDDMLQKDEDPRGDFKGKWVKVFHPAEGDL